MNITADATLRDSGSYFVTGMISSVVGICTCQSYIRIISRHKVSVLTKKQEVFLVFLGCFEIGAIVSVIALIGNNVPATNRIINGLFVGFILVDIYIITLFESVSKNNELQLKTYLLEQQQLMDIRYYEEVEMQNEKYKRVMHDIRKHIEVLTQTKNIDEIYGREILELINKQGHKFRCNNPILNIIIND